MFLRVLKQTLQFTGLSIPVLRKRGRQNVCVVRLPIVHSKLKHAFGLTVDCGVRFLIRNAHKNFLPGLDRFCFMNEQKHVSVYHDGTQAKFVLWSRVAK